MAGILWIIIIVAIVIGEVKKQRRRQQGNSRAGQRYQPPQQNYRPVNQNVARRQQESMAAMNAKQQELKNRLTQRYGKPGGMVVNQNGNVWQRAGQQNIKRQPPQQPGDILSRANANVRENEKDLLEQQMAVKHEGGPMVRDAHDLVGAVDIAESSELMRQVSDLMIMGYQADLTFERDFLAEGVELLNRYELPTGI